MIITSAIIIGDASTNYQINFQDPASPVMEGIIDLHHDIMFFLVVVVFFVLWLLLKNIMYFNNNKLRYFQVLHETKLEIIWTTVPSLVLLLLSVPAFALLYAMDEITRAVITFKAIGHQWYWTYEYADSVYGVKNILKFDSYMILEENLYIGALRLLEVDSRVVLPVKVHIRILITSADVLHSWAIPSLGIKLDACPGRLNQTSIHINRQGVFYGSCSEICGINHAFMPIVVESHVLEIITLWYNIKVV